MPRYKFEGSVETVLCGLRNGIEAEQIGDQPKGSTVVVQPGCEVTTKAPYPHRWLVNVETGVPDLPGAAPEKKPRARKPRKPAKPRAARKVAKPREEKPPADEPVEIETVPAAADADAVASEGANE